MSKPLATKVSTHLSKNVQIGPKLSIFYVATIIFLHCLTLLGMEFTRASQFATGVLFHSSMMTSQSWLMLETLCSSTFCLSMPHRLPLPSASLARQWSSWRCVWGRYHVGILPCGPVSEGRGSCSASACSVNFGIHVPSMNCSFSVPAALMQPQTMTLPPPCLTVGQTHLSLFSWNHVLWSDETKITYFVQMVSSVCGGNQEYKDSLLVFSKLFAGFLVHHL